MASPAPTPPTSYPIMYPHIVPTPGQIKVPINDPTAPRAAAPRTLAPVAIVELTALF